MKIKRKKSARQLNQEVMRNILETHGIKTWRTYRNRNQMAVLFYLACNRLNKENPVGAAEVIRVRAHQILGKTFTEI